MSNDTDRAPDASGPVGTANHTVREGECINSIAYDYGFFWETIWNDPGNAELRDKRGNPDLLLPGDRLVVPGRRPNTVSAATATRHRFRRKGVPVELALRIMKDQSEAGVVEGSPDDNNAWSYDDRPREAKKAPDPKPEANQPYHLYIDGKCVEGTTDGDGVLREAVPPRARSGRLVLRPGKRDERIIDLALGDMDPVSEPRGAAKRLCNLGYPCDPDHGMTPDVIAALRVFQHERGIDATGKLDQQTQDALSEAHGS